jgi:hypothetical protein
MMCIRDFLGVYIEKEKGLFFKKRKWHIEEKANKIAGKKKYIRERRWMNDELCIVVFQI